MIAQGDAPTSTSASCCRASASPRWSCTARASWSGTCATRATWPSTSPAPATSSSRGSTRSRSSATAMRSSRRSRSSSPAGAAAMAPARELLTVMFTDIVDATALAARLGDGRWRDLLARHDDDRAQGARALRRPRGQDGRRRLPGDVCRSAIARAALRAGDHRAAHELELEVRIGMHTGECELIGEDVGGMAVHIASRVSGARRPRRGARLGHGVRDGRGRPL